MSPLRESYYIAAYLRRKLPFIAAWDAKATVAWVQWFMRHNRAIALYSHRRLVGVVLVRLVDDARQAATDYADTGGKMAYIEVTAARNGAMPALFHSLRASFPHTDTMAWVRSKFQNRPCVIPMHRALARFI